MTGDIPVSLAISSPVFSMTTVAVAQLYLGTHSMMVTLIGTVAASLLAGCVIWLPGKQCHAIDKTSQRPIQQQPYDQAAERELPGFCHCLPILAELRADGREHELLRPPPSIMAVSVGLHEYTARRIGRYISAYSHAAERARSAWFRVASAATCAARLVRRGICPCHNSRSLVETAAAARSVPATCIKTQRHGSDSLKTWASASPPFCAPGSQARRRWLRS